jgi:hypothetical protein
VARSELTLKGPQRSSPALRPYTTFLAGGRIVPSDAATEWASDTRPIS